MCTGESGRAGTDYRDLFALDDVLPGCNLVREVPLPLVSRFLGSFEEGVLGVGIERFNSEFFRHKPLESPDAHRRIDLSAAAPVFTRCGTDAPTNARKRIR